MILSPNASLNLTLVPMYLGTSKVSPILTITPVSITSVVSSPKKIPEAVCSKGLSLLISIHSPGNITLSNSYSYYSSNGLICFIPLVFACSNNSCSTFSFIECKF